MLQAEGRLCTLLHAFEHSAKASCTKFGGGPWPPKLLPAGAPSMTICIMLRPRVGTIQNEHQGLGTRQTAWYPR